MPERTSWQRPLNVRGNEPTISNRRLVIRRFAIASLLASTVVARSAGIEGADQPFVISGCCSVHISADSPETPYVETFLAINPRDAKNLIVTSMVGVAGSIRSRVYVSRDEGRTWRRTEEVTGGDPVVYFDAKGTAFFGFLNASGFLVRRSNDGGLSWQSPVILQGRGWDRPYLAFDDTGGKFNGRIYAGGTNTVTDVSGRNHQAAVITFSNDGGRTFAPNTVLTGNSGPIADLLVTPDGKLVIIFRATSDPAPLPNVPNSSRLWTMVSDDGGATFSPAAGGPSITSAAGFRMLKSLPVVRATMDVSNGRYRNTIYVTWTDFDGKKYAVKVARTTDLGKTWSAAATVNDNINEGDPANPAITVDKEGMLGVAFNDRRDDPENSCFRLYFSASVDGGETFLPNVRANDQPTCPLAPGNWAASAVSLSPTTDTNGAVISITSIATRWPNGGETQGLSAGGNGVFYSAWINGESGVMQLWSRKLTVDKTLAKSAVVNSRRRVSHDLIMEVSDPSIDFQTHTVSVRVRLVNPFNVAVLGPFTAVLGDALGTLMGLRALNSENGESARGATWDFKADGGSLQPQQKSEERVLRWTFTKPEHLAFGVPFSAHFVILGGPIP